MNNYDQLRMAIIANKEIYIAIITKEHECTKEQAESLFDAELETFLQRVKKYISMHNNNPKNTNRQIGIGYEQGVNIFLEVMQAGLSFSEESKHIYLFPLKGTGNLIGYQIQADGLIYQAQKAGAISHCSEVVLVQEGEQFAIANTQDGRHVANHEIIFNGRPRFNFQNFLLGYVYVVYPNGQRELSWITKTRLEEHRMKSSSPDMYNDESFIKTKVIKNALRKVRRKGFFRGKLEVEEDLPIPDQNSQFQPSMIMPPHDYTNTNQVTIPPIGFDTNTF